MCKIPDIKNLTCSILLADDEVKQTLLALPCGSDGLTFKDFLFSESDNPKITNLARQVAYAELIRSLSDNVAPMTVHYELMREIPVAHIEEFLGDAELRYPELVRKEVMAVSN